MAQKAIADRIAQVVQKGLDMLETALKVHSAEHTEQIGDLQASPAQNHLLNELLIRLGDNNTRLRERVDALLTQMS